MSGNTGYSHDRRLTPRHKFSLPVKYRACKSELPERAAESLDISEGGISFTTHSPPEEGETIEVRFEMPEEVVDEPTAEWRCTGQVLKVEAFGTHPIFRIRVRFDCYEVRRPNGTTVVRLDLNSLRFGSPSVGR